MNAVADLLKQLRADGLTSTKSSGERLSRQQGRHRAAEGVGDRAQELSLGLCHVSVRGDARSTRHQKLLRAGSVNLHQSLKRAVEIL
jgi:hypothetical protein